jgi:mevalonate kinase
MIKLSLPGSLLLAGEYSILTPEGMGIYMAAGPRAIITLKEDRQFRLLFRMGRDWKESMYAEKEPLWLAVKHAMGLESAPPTLKISIDTSTFYNNGDSLGYKSSAAAIAGLLAVFHHRTIHEPDGIEKLIIPAIKAQKYFDKTSTGIEIVAALLGGTGLFIGGEVPIWRNINIELPQGLGLIRNSKISKTKALSNWNRWKSINESDWLQHKEFSNQLIEQFIAVADSSVYGHSNDSLNSFGLLRSLGELGALLGESIDVPAKLTIEDDSWIKSLGLGNELALGLSNESLKMQRQGLRLEN